VFTRVSQSGLIAGATITHLCQKEFVNFIYKLQRHTPRASRIATILSDMARRNLNAGKISSAKSRQKSSRQDQSSSAKDSGLVMSGGPANPNAPRKNRVSALFRCELGFVTSVTGPTATSTSTSRRASHCRISARSSYTRQNQQRRLQNCVPKRTATAAPPTGTPAFTAAAARRCR